MNNHDMTFLSILQLLQSLYSTCTILMIVYQINVDLRTVHVDLYGNILYRPVLYANCLLCTSARPQALNGRIVTLTIIVFAYETRLKYNNTSRVIITIHDYSIYAVRQIHELESHKYYVIGRCSGNHPRHKCCN